MQISLVGSVRFLRSLCTFAAYKYFGILENLFHLSLLKLLL